MIRRFTFNTGTKKEETFNIRWRREYIEIEYENDYDEFSWRFSNSEIFEILNIFLNSKETSHINQSTVLKVGYLFERSIIHVT